MIGLQSQKIRTDAANTDCITNNIRFCTSISRDTSCSWHYNLRNKVTFVSIDVQLYSQSIIEIRTNTETIQNVWRWCILISISFEVKSRICSNINCLIYINRQIINVGLIISNLFWWNDVSDVCSIIRTECSLLEALRHQGIFTEVCITVGE